jgi:outer membrane lipoprotein-sorting protein
MRRKTLAILAAVAVLAAVLVVGVVTAAAKGPSSLPQIGVAQLLRNVATRAQGTTAVSGDVAWSNDLLGSASSLLSLGNATPTGLSSLLAGGSGRVWVQDGKLRLEQQGQNGDFVAIANGATVWTWDSVTSTATRYALPAAKGATSGASASMAAPSPAAGLDPTTAIAALISHLAPTAKLSVAGQTTVAGRPAYRLKLTPTSAVTSVGSVMVAIDGQRWLPLRVQVFARGDGTPILSAGFTSVSFHRLSSSLFTFSPPAGSTVVRKAFSMPSLGASATGVAPRHTAAEHAVKPLTLAQAGTRASYLLTPSSTPAGFAFRGAFVTPAAVKAAKGLSAAQRAAAAALVGHRGALLVYGQGLGTVLVVEAKTTAAQDAQIQHELGRLSVLGGARVDGAPATRLQTALGSVVTFRRGDVRVVVVGLVPWSDVAQIAGSLH